MLAAIGSGLMPEDPTSDVHNILMSTALLSPYKLMHIQSYLGDVAGLFVDHCNKANTAIKKKKN